MPKVFTTKLPFLLSRHAWRFSFNGSPFLSSYSSKLLVCRRHAHQVLTGSTSSLGNKEQPPKDTDPKDLSPVPPKYPLINVRDIPAPHCGHIRVISLNSPHNKNAISTQMLEELDKEVSEINKQAMLEAKGLEERKLDTTIGSGTRVVIFASDVNRVFCAGADLKERANMSPTEVNAFLNQLRATFDTISNMSVPSISAVCAVALGGGFELALATTFRIFTPATEVGLPETRLGIIPGAGGTYRLQQVLSRPQALDMLLTGHRVKGKQAYFRGLCDRQEVLDSAVEMAKEICQGAPASTMVLTRLIKDGASAKREAEAYRTVLQTDDRNEALKAFGEERKPIFTGRLKPLKGLIFRPKRGDRYLKAD
ncbi:MAG: hypothetical protein Q9202_003321 [Teloschistes flavicans]